MIHEVMEPSNFVLKYSNTTSLTCTCKIKPCKASFILVILAQVIGPQIPVMDLVNIWSYRLDQLGLHLDLYY